MALASNTLVVVVDLVDLVAWVAMIHQAAVYTTMVHSFFHEHANMFII